MSLSFWVEIKMIFKNLRLNFDVGKKDKRSKIKYKHSILEKQRKVDGFCCLKGTLKKTEGLITLHKSLFCVNTLKLNKKIFSKYKKIKKMAFGIKKKMRLKNAENLRKSRLKSKFTVSY